MNHTRLRKNSNRQLGQTLPLMAVLILVLLLMVGMAVDMGFAMVTKAALSKACDAAALAAIRNYPLGEATAQTIAQNSFTANYNQPTRSAAPTVTMGWSSDASNNTYFTVTASAKINTFFIRVLPQWQNMTISANAQTVRAHVVMSLVLDRSGSMTKNGGAAALPPAVTTFVGFFDNTLDQMEEASFSTNVIEDFVMGHNFQAPITAAVDSMQFGGGTWSQGGLIDAHNAISGVSIPAGQNTAKVVVFFTDGRANTNQDSLACPALTVYNTGGCSPAERGAPYNCTDLWFFIGPSPPPSLCTATSPSNVLGCGWKGPAGEPPPGTPDCVIVDNGNPGGSQTVTPASAGCACAANTFLSLQTQKQTQFSQLNVTNEAEYRAIQLALQDQNAGVYYYSIGLGDTVNQTFLQQIANDPASPTFNPNLPIGEAVFAPTAADLDSAFQTIAQRILYRLSQ